MARGAAGSSTGRSAPLGGFGSELCWLQEASGSWCSLILKDSQVMVPPAEKPPWPSKALRTSVWVPKALMPLTSWHLELAIWAQSSRGHGGGMTGWDRAPQGQDPCPHVPRNMSVPLPALHARHHHHHLHLGTLSHTWHTSTGVLLIHAIAGSIGNSIPDKDKSPQSHLLMSPTWASPAASEIL